MLLISSGVGHSGLPVLFGLKPDRLAHERSFFLTGVISTAFSSCSPSTTVPSLSPNFALNSLGMSTRPRSSLVDCMLFPMYLVGRYLSTAMYFRTAAQSWFVGSTLLALPSVSIRLH